MAITELKLLMILTFKYYNVELVVDKPLKISGTFNNCKELKIKPPPVGSVKRRLGDITKIKHLIGWGPETSLDEGLKKTIEWYIKNPKK